VFREEKIFAFLHEVQAVVAGGYAMLEPEMQICVQYGHGPRNGILIQAKNILGIAEDVQVH
jgi:hypothetical protein